MTNAEETNLEKQDMTALLQEILADGLLPAPHARGVRLMLKTLINSHIIKIHDASETLPPPAKRVLAWPMGGNPFFTIMSGDGVFINGLGEVVNVVAWAEV